MALRPPCLRRGGLGRTGRWGPGQPGHRVRGARWPGGSPSYLAGLASCASWNACCGNQVPGAGSFIPRSGPNSCCCAARLRCSRPAHQHW